MAPITISWEETCPNAVCFGSPLGARTIVAGSITTVPQSAPSPLSHPRFWLCSH
jgi:hypothetical protein